MADESLWLSYSSISMYQGCPLSYKLRYLDKIIPRPTKELSFGSSIHDTLAAFYLEAIKEREVPPREKIRELLREHWKSEGYTDIEEENNFKRKAFDLMVRYYESVRDDFVYPEYIERKFSLDIGDGKGDKLIGFIDRVDRNQTGGLEIIDYKTSKKASWQKDVDADLQLSIYNLAAKSVFNELPEKLTLHFLLPDTKVHTKRTEEQNRETLQTVEYALRSIKNDRAEYQEFLKDERLQSRNPLARQKAFEQVKNERSVSVFDPNSDYKFCNWCEYKSTFCPVYREESAPVSVASINEYSDLPLFG